MELVTMACEYTHTYIRFSVTEHTRLGISFKNNLNCPLCGCKNVAKSHLCVWYNVRFLSPFSFSFMMASQWLLMNHDVVLIHLQNRCKMMEVYNKQSLKTMQQHVSTLNTELTKYRSVAFLSSCHTCIYFKELIFSGTCCCLSVAKLVRRHNCRHCVAVTTGIQSTCCGVLSVATLVIFTIFSRSICFMELLSCPQIGKHLLLFFFVSFHFTWLSNSLLSVQDPEPWKGSGAPSGWDSQTGT